MSGKKFFELLRPKRQIWIGLGAKQYPWEQILAKKSRVDEHPDTKGSKMGQKRPDTNLRILAKSHLTFIGIIRGPAIRWFEGNYVACFMIVWYVDR